MTHKRNRSTGRNRCNPVMWNKSTRYLTVVATNLLKEEVSWKWKLKDTQKKTEIAAQLFSKYRRIGAEKNKYKRNSWTRNKKNINNTWARVFMSPFQLLLHARNHLNSFSMHEFLPTLPAYLEKRDCFSTHYASTLKLKTPHIPTKTSASRQHFLSYTKLEHSARNL